MLVDVYDDVLPCFPPSFDPLDVFAKEFTEQASYVLDALGQASPMLDNGSLLSLLAWPDSFRRTLLGLGVGDEAMQLSTRPRVRTPLGDSVPLHGLDVARLVYIDRIREQLAAAFRNLADIDLLREPEPDGRGRLWTPGVIELFRFLTQQVQLAAGVRDPEVVNNVAGVALQIMQSCAAPRFLSPELTPLRKTCRAHIVLFFHNDHHAHTNPVPAALTTLLLGSSAALLGKIALRDSKPNLF